MCIKKLGLWALVLAACFVAGCNPIDVDLSPDGKTMVFPTGDGIALKPVDGNRPARTVRLEAGPQVETRHRKKSKVSISSPIVRAPRYSPDGNWILVAESSRTALIDTRSLSKYPIQGIEPPYAWSPDSRFFLGANGRKMKVFSTRSRDYIRAIRLPESPDNVIWAALNDIVIAGKHVLYVCKGQNRIKVYRGLQGTIEGFDPRTRSVLWFRALDRSHGDHFSFRFSVKSTNIDTGHVITMIPLTSSARIFPKGKGMVPLGAVALSPLGNQIAIFAGIDTSPPTLYRRLVHLRRRANSHPSKALRNELAVLEAKFERGFIPTFATISLDGKRHIKSIPTGSVFAYKGTPDKVDLPNLLVSKLFWSHDGKSLVLADNDTAKRIPITP